MKCRQCGADTKVVSTRPWLKFYTTREHWCFNEHKFRTYEVHAAALDRRALREGLTEYRMTAAKRRAIVAANPQLGSLTLAKRLKCTAARVRQIKLELAAEAAAIERRKRSEKVPDAVGEADGKLPARPANWMLGLDRET